MGWNQYQNAATIESRNRYDNITHQRTSKNKMMVRVWEKSADAFINRMPSLDKNFTQAYYLVYVKCPNAIRMKFEDYIELEKPELCDFVVKEKSS